jgi:hypothetical protein
MPELDTRNGLLAATRRASCDLDANPSISLVLMTSTSEFP